MSLISFLSPNIFFRCWYLGKETDLDLVDLSHPLGHILRVFETGRSSDEGGQDGAYKQTWKPYYIMLD